MRTAVDDPSLPDSLVMLRHDAFIRTAQEYARRASFAETVEEAASFRKLFKLELIFAEYLVGQSSRLMRAAPDELPQA